MDRKHEIKIRLSKEELDSLNLKVAKTNLSREEFCRLCFKEVAIKAKPSDDTHRLIYEMRKIGGNQIKALRKEIDCLEKVEQRSAQVAENIKTITADRTEFNRINIKSRDERRYR